MLTQEDIETQINEWSGLISQMQDHRQRLAAQLSDLDISIQRHTGAIIGAQELLKKMGGRAAAEPVSE